MSRAPAWPFLLSIVPTLLSCSDGALEPLEDASIIEVRATLDRASVLPGDSLRVTVTARNPTDRTLLLEGDCGPLLSFAVRPSGSDSEPRGSDCVFPAVTTLRPVREVFGPRELKEEAFLWTAERKDFGSGFPARLVPVDAGFYEVLGILFSSAPTVVSDPVAVEVLPTLTLALEAEPATAAVGEVVTIRASVTNELNRAVSLTILSACTFGITVELGGSQVADLSGDCDIVDRQLPLGPRERHEEVTLWEVSEPGSFLISSQLGVPTLESELGAQAQVTVR